MVIYYILITKQFILCEYKEKLHTDKLAGLKGLSALYTCISCIRYDHLLSIHNFPDLILKR